MEARGRLPTTRAALRGGPFCLPAGQSPSCAMIAGLRDGAAPDRIPGRAFRRNSTVLRPRPRELQARFPILAPRNLKTEVCDLTQMRAEMFEHNARSAASTSQLFKSHLGNVRRVFSPQSANCNDLLGDKLRDGVAAIFQTQRL